MPCGNAASNQNQLDVYGEVADSLYIARRVGIPAEHEAWALALKLLDFLEGAWRHPDEGIWEIRGDPQQFTYSKVMAWVAFDRTVKTIESGARKGDADRWKRVRMLAAGNIVQNGASTLAALAPNVGLLTAARGVGGLGQGISQPTVVPLLSDWYP